MINQKISIHALLAESDLVTTHGAKRVRNFYPRSPCGERLWVLRKVPLLGIFLSTLSLRRATHYDNYNLHCVEISIHALLAESDLGGMSERLIGSVFLSTLSLRRATKYAPLLLTYHLISIHALLAESDNRGAYHVKRYEISIHALLAESDIDKIPNQRQIDQFLSTLSLRRATTHTNQTNNRNLNFYPRSPCGERLDANRPCKPCGTISIHALLAESDNCFKCSFGNPCNFYPRSPCGERQKTSRS